MQSKTLAHDLAAALRQCQLLGDTGRHSGTFPRHSDTQLIAAADKVIQLCGQLAASVRIDYPHSEA